MLKKQESIYYYVATVTYMLHGAALYSDVLIVTESINKAFKVIDTNDYMNVIREETYPDDAELIERSHNKYFGINEHGDEVYEDTVYVECKTNEDLEPSYCTVMHQITKKELA